MRTGPDCESTTITASLHVTGTCTANANGTYEDNTTSSGDVKFSLAKECLLVSSTPTTCEKIGSLFEALGYPATCTTVADGGCACSGTIHQNGGLGLPSGAPSTSGNYKTSGNQVTLTDAGDTNYSYCVSGDQMTVTPVIASPAVTGTIVFQKGIARVPAVGVGRAVRAARAEMLARAVRAAQGESLGRAVPPAPVLLPGPLRIYKGGGTPCVGGAQHRESALRSVWREALSGSQRGRMTKDITAVRPGVSQTRPRKTHSVRNHLRHHRRLRSDAATATTSGTRARVARSDGKDTCDGEQESLKIGGPKVYSLYINPGNSYWVDGSKSGMPWASTPRACTW